LTIIDTVLLFAIQRLRLIYELMRYTNIVLFLVLL